MLSPTEQYIRSKDEINSNSLVCKILIKDKQLLYMGDATLETEEALIREYNKLKNIYILKVGHHGSKSSTGEKFIQKVKPENAVISADKRYYGHPHSQVTSILKKYNVNIYITEKQGAIKFKI